MNRILRALQEAWYSPATHFISLMLCILFFVLALSEAIA